MTIPTTWNVSEVSYSERISISIACPFLWSHTVFTSCMAQYVLFKAQTIKEKHSFPNKHLDVTTVPLYVIYQGLLSAAFCKHFHNQY